MRAFSSSWKRWLFEKPLVVAVEGLWLFPHNTWSLFPLLILYIIFISELWFVFIPSALHRIRVLEDIKWEDVLYIRPSWLYCSFGKFLFAYLVLEYVPGQTLAERIAKSPRKLEKALTITLQIAYNKEVLFSLYFDWLSKIISLAAYVHPLWFF